MTPITRHDEVVHHLRRHVELRAASAGQNVAGEVGQDTEGEENGDTTPGG